jgi:hypothetical protein
MIYRGGNTDIKFYVSKKNERPTVIDSKTKSNKKEIQLSEPLRGLPDGVCDKFVKQGGKWYVERNCCQIVLTEDILTKLGWATDNDNKRYIYVLGCLPYAKAYSYVYTDKIPFVDDIYNSSYFGINFSTVLIFAFPTEIQTNQEKKELIRPYLQNGGLKVVYQLVTPTYEEITDPQVITYLDTTHISNNSTIPCNMQIKNSGYNAIIKPSTQYTVALNANINEEINVDLGGTEVTTTNNIITITTPNTLTNENLMLYGKNVVINNAMLFEGDMTSNLPSRYIEGLKSSFEDGYIPSEDLILDSWFYGNQNVDVIQDGDYAIAAQSGNSTEGNIVVRIPTICKANTLYTLVSLDGMKGCIIRDDKNGQNLHIMGPSDKVIYATTFQTKQELDTIHFYYYKIKVNDTVKVSNNFMILEGDWTHLTEEDLNHLGQYKVEYKVVGKNKFDINKAYQIYLTNNTINGNARTWALSILTGQSGTNSNRTVDKLLYLKKGYYIINCVVNKFIPLDSENFSFVFSIRNYDKDGNCISHHKAELNSIVELTCDGYYDIQIGNRGEFSISNIQLEEGTVATEYEPYKESIQTVYLNSPLLQGDTIEEIDGEVYHVHRCGKVVLDGSQYVGSVIETTDGLGFRCYASLADTLYGVAIPGQWGSIEPKHNSEIFKLDRNAFSEGTKYHNTLYAQYGAIYMNFSKDTLPTANSNTIKQWLQQNPTTVVYELANPTYELIPSSSIVCKSYPNGHLDFDTNVHIDNTVNFVKANLPITYANTSTNYKLQFVSNKDMENVTINALGNIMENVTITKGLNKISFTSPSDATNILTFEGLGYAYISDVQLVATEKDIDYFKGLYSTYECGLIEDESNENYGKYEVNIVSHNAPIQFGKGGKIE